MRVYRKQIQQAKEPQKPAETTATPAAEKPSIEISIQRQRRVDFIRDIVAQARARG